ncbi:uncharacterized protein LOC134260178 [Saccostrea cucullata]|uniref:uncharacterized protein LOC134260178 n=1 Tax=Saccostrea cuccullata TaxID=36930 RepID=UPI002ED4B992
MQYNSKNKEFRKLPPKVQVSLPTFSPKIVNIDQFCEIFGFLTPLHITTEENGYKLKKSKSETLSRELLEKPELITTIKTGYENLLSVTCFGNEEIWTRANKDIDMKCFNNHGSVLKKIKTKSGGQPNDIALTDDGDLVYADGKNGL